MTTTATEPTTLGELRAILELVPSPLNPRKHFDKQKLEELAASIASKGIIEPLIVRPFGGSRASETFEIVAGERRYRAAKMAKHDLVPVIIRQLSDVEVLELMAIENSQRDDLHPLEEADGFASLMKADRAYTPKAIAAKIGKSERYVQQRLQLASLDTAVKKAFFDNEITAGHAELIVRLSPTDQGKALKACFANLFGDDKENGVISVRDLKRWIEDHIRLELTPGTPALQEFPELAAIVDKAGAEQPLSLVQVSSTWSSAPKGVLEHSAYRTVKKSDQCKSVERAVVVIGGGERGRIIDICRDKKCKKHWPHLHHESTARRATTVKKPKETPQAKAAAARQLAKEQKAKAREVLREKVLATALAQLKKSAPKKPDHLLAIVAGSLFYNRKERERATWATVAIESADRWLQDVFDESEYAVVAKAFKPLGIDFAALEQELAPTAEPQTSAKPKKAAKK